MAGAVQRTSNIVKELHFSAFNMNDVHALILVPWESAESFGRIVVPSWILGFVLLRRLRRHSLSSLIDPTHENGGRQ